MPFQQQTAWAYCFFDVVDQYGHSHALWVDKEAYAMIWSDFSRGGYYIGPHLPANVLDDSTRAQTQAELSNWVQIIVLYFMLFICYLGYPIS